MATSALAVDSSASTPSSIVGDAFFCSEDGAGSSKTPLYLPLDEIQQEVRLLTLHAGSDDSPIEATLEPTSLLNAGSFIAFSYCWGPPGDESEVVLNGQVICIRQNLWLFLQNFRSVRGSGRLWIDYLCIDQSSVHERNHQVKLMRNIFSAAISVYAWLGESTPDTDNAIGYINLALSIPYKRRSKSIAPEVRLQGMKALRSLIRRDYWTRVWIIQEILLAQKVFLMIGDRVIDWEHLQDVATARLAPHVSWGKTKNSASRQNFRSIWELKRQKRKIWKLYDVLERFHHADCHDPRDKLYGLLGLASAPVRSQVIVDYTSSVMEVCAANMEVICGRFPTKGERGLSPSQVEHVVRYVFGDRARLLHAFYDKSLPSQMKTPVMIEATIHRRPMSFITFAAFNSEEDTYVQMTPANEGISYDSYLTIYQSNDHDGRILCSATHSRDWDFILEFGSFAILPVRRIAGSYTVIEIGGSAMTLLEDACFGICPSDWRCGRVPEVQCSLIDDPMDASWKVQLNSTAFVETMRICNSHKTWNMRDINLTMPSGECWKEGTWKDPTTVLRYDYGRDGQGSTSAPGSRHTQLQGTERV